MHPFFANSQQLDILVLKPLNKIQPNWLLNWDDENRIYVQTPDCFACKINYLIDCIQAAPYSINYTDQQQQLMSHLISLPLPKTVFELNQCYILLLKNGFYIDKWGQDLISLLSTLVNRLQHIGFLHFDHLDDRMQKKTSLLMSLILFDWYRLDIFNEKFSYNPQ
ncbi:MAG: hypothetical protein CENE_03445 [Candidatus Celerinatantimonas neptuna]|nr:MAG: hypothetical protein CENE_03445 [Candidatus Celerinatantimonas neptuna]